MSDVELIQRLRGSAIHDGHSPDWWVGFCDTVHEAADAIARLTRERDEAQEKLREASTSKYFFAEKALAAEAREAKLREALETISARDGWFDGDSVRVARVALTTKGEPMPVYQNDGRVTTSATVPSSRSDRDPVQEAVERGVIGYDEGRCAMNLAWFGATVPPMSDANRQSIAPMLRSALAAALAPYGGLEAAIKKLEEGR